ncbi:MAG: hypothetical protein NZ518_08655, partial [Dehalococcoidia bacterium]|nr:hypothetical protein [Dehalococcoidia bacterium]
PAPEGTVLALHHPPVRIGGRAPFVADADELEAVVRGSDVIAVLAGHVHQVMAQEFGGAPLVTAHSTVMLIDPLRRPGIAFVAGGGFALVTVQDRRALIQPFLLPVLPEVVYHHNPALAPVHDDMKVFTNV